MASSSRGVQQDSFIDDDDLTCPLCVEEFDLSDRNFRPCPCGYQVCQFCFNNIKTNMNGLCPACRRPYDEKTIEWKVVTPEEIAQFKAKIQKDAKKKAEIRQREAQKREVENLNRKHLSGLRVVQKNLVYVVGLSHGIPEQDLLQTLRGEKYFGQYGKIIKIVVSKAKSADPSPSLGVYVTFARKEDAARCIAAVNGSTNLDRVLRAQLGTTKYCSAYLRNETCTNKQCMFLHESSENDDSYSRQDLSSINSVGTQRPLPNMSSSSRQVAQAQAPLQHTQPITAAASQSMVRDSSKDGSDSGDGSALPSSASWANRGTHQLSRRGSNTTASSPAVSAAMPAPIETVEDFHDSADDQQDETAGESTSDHPSPMPKFSASTRPDVEPTLLRLLKSISALKACPGSLSHLGFDERSCSDFPPLFDDQGGMKRKALREQQEETRLHMDQESQVDLRSVSDALEEEEPESGSLQLGGEPEDRHESREGTGQTQSFHDQRRPSVQMPIQRASHDGFCGGGLSQNFPPNLSNLSSISGRNLTPMEQQRLMLIKSGQVQSNFMDQFPPGIGASSQSSIFQQQGHNRQSSRYNFANENSSSSSSAKNASNSKLGGPQASMIAPQQTQFYSSSIPGPPPGLKSTGTPPMNGSGMFSPSHGFGGGASAFGGTKDSNSDMLREMLRNRGGMAGSGQMHDAGKREFMFPSFLHQYPSASTPAPASGILASLYGSQPGAFQDFGQKQKKKGKKHRHANTSSSGGGGLVDLADPGMFQARMPLQQQSNAGVGQGLFGGHGQGQDDVLPSLDEASISVDALVADSAADFSTNRLDSTPNLASYDLDSAAATAASDFDFLASRTSTPSVPPGLALPHAHPAPLVREDTLQKPMSRIVPTSAPFTPSRNLSSAYIPHAATPLGRVPVPMSTQGVASFPSTISSTSQARRDVKTLAANTGLAKTITLQSAQGMQGSILKPDDFPELDKGKGKLDALVGPKIMAPIPKTLHIAINETSLPQSIAKASAKRPPPGMLSIATLGQHASNVNTESDGAVKSIIPASAFPPLPPSAPSSAITQSPAIRTNPKTLRLVPTPKSEVPPLGISTPQSASSIVPPNFVPPSRQPSIVSLSRNERPGTPVSEIISDNASITSISLSRPSSPPAATRVGSAPVRSTTKSQQKKQRREAKEKSDLDTVVDKPEPEVEIAPIMGRKKKQKKEKINSSIGVPSPAISRAASPGPQEMLQGQALSKSEKATDTNVIVQTQEPEIEQPVSRVSEPKGKTKPKAEDIAPLESPMLPIEIADDQGEKTIPTPASILSDLASSGLLPDPNKLNIFKSPFGFTRVELPIDFQDADQKLIITEDDRANLQAGKPVHKVSQGFNRIMLTPNGDCVRNLTAAEEERYLELQSRILDDTGPATFVPPRHAVSGGFALIGGRAVPNGPPAYFPPTDASVGRLDPVGKIQRDEALSYINQFVLPSLSSNSQLERALNANALDADMLRPNDMGSWGGTSQNAADIVEHHVESNSIADRSYGVATRDNSILATGLQTMTAHFALGQADGHTQPLGSVALLSLEDSEKALQTAKKETEKLEKSLNQLLKKNRRLLLGAGH